MNEEQLKIICEAVSHMNGDEALNNDDILQITTALREYNDAVIDFEDFTEIIYNASMVNSNALLPDFEEHYQNCLSVEENIYEFFKWSESEEQ